MTEGGNRAGLDMMHKRNQPQRVSPFFFFAISVPREEKKKKNFDRYQITANYSKTQGTLHP